MKQKQTRSIVIRPFSVINIIRYLCGLLLFALGVGGIACGIAAPDEWDVFERFLVFVMGLLCCFVGFIHPIVCGLIGRIIIDESKVKVIAEPKNLLNGKPLQHSFEIKYDDIASVDVVEMTTDTKKKNLKSFICMPCLVFVRKDQKTEALNLYHYGKKQRIRLLQDVIRLIKTQNEEFDGEKLLQKMKDFRLDWIGSKSKRQGNN